ncbi:MAG: hypothetical protein IH861_10300 [Chloroflexi bacterium]|nr:hypothetical protein [Chloroflexota bacterium]
MVSLAVDAELGSILADADGNTLYLFMNDEREKSNCSGGCATAWPPLLTDGDPVAGEGVDEGRLGTIARDDGGTQVTFNGWPLYYFVSDEAPGDTNGQAIDNWWVVSEFGGPIQSNALVNIGEDASLGTILVDHSGRTQYLFTPDERDVSNCAGGCARAWPPLLTVGDPVAGDGVNAGRLGTITRDDGSTQVTFNGWPVYYFANDDKPGDTNGQAVNNWWVISEFGGPVQTDAVVGLTDDAELGGILIDESTGRTLYLFTPDERDVSNCAGGCALAWPPLLTEGTPGGAEGLNADLITTMTRGDGSTQVSFNGWPLYYFAGDDKPGDTKGQTINNWWVLSVFGGPIQTDAAVNVSENAEFGDILSDHSGRTLYLFTPDEPNTSNCEGGCAEQWPPLLTSGDPVAGDGASAGLLGTTVRDDGSIQVTYDSQPLYYFAGDDRPGDANGQTLGDVWFVLSPDGQAVMPAAVVVAPRSPSVGDTAIPRLAQGSLVAALVLIASGSLIFFMRRRRTA